MKVTVYTSSHTDSPFCKAELEYLKSKNITFEERDVYKEAANLSEMMSLSENFSGVPFTILTLDDGTEHKLKGFTGQEFDKVLMPADTVSGVTATVPPVVTAPTVLEPTSTTPASTAPPLRSPSFEGQAAPVAPASPIDTEAKSRIDSLLSDLQLKSSNTTPFGQGVSSPAPLPSTPPVVPPVAGSTTTTTTTTAPAPSTPSGELPNIPNFPGK